MDRQGRRWLWAGRWGLEDPSCWDHPKPLAGPSRPRQSSQGVGQHPDLAALPYQCSGYRRTTTQACRGLSSKDSAGTHRIWIIGALDEALVAIGVRATATSRSPRVCSRHPFPVTEARRLPASSPVVAAEDRRLSAAVQAERQPGGPRRSSGVVQGGRLPGRCHRGGPIGPSTRRSSRSGTQPGSPWWPSVRHRGIARALRPPPGTPTR